MGKKKGRGGGEREVERMGREAAPGEEE